MCIDWPRNPVPRLSSPPSALPARFRSALAPFRLELCLVIISVKPLRETNDPAARLLPFAKGLQGRNISWVAYMGAGWLIECGYD